MSERVEIDWNKGDGLVPAIVQDADGGRVLMLGYMNEAALARTREHGWVTFYSRSRQCLWTKGETSGNRLELVEVRADCDRDTLLVRARPTGPVCHLGKATCFDDGPIAGGGSPGREPRHSDPHGFLDELAEIIARRADERPRGSYVAQLLEAGTAKCAQKVGEEGVELALAAVDGDDRALIGEAADLLFHLLVLLQARGTGLDEVVSELARRHRAAH